MECRRAPRKPGEKRRTIDQGDRGQRALAETAGYVRCYVLVAFLVGTGAPWCAFGGAIVRRLAPGAVAILWVVATDAILWGLARTRKTQSQGAGNVMFAVNITTWFAVNITTWIGLAVLTPFWWGLGGWYCR